MSDKIPYAFIDFYGMHADRPTLTIYYQDDGKHAETVGYAVSLYYAQGIPYSLRYAPEPEPPDDASMHQAIEELVEVFFDGVPGWALTFDKDQEDDGMDPDFVIIAPQVELAQIAELCDCLRDFEEISDVFVSIVPNVPNVHNDSTLRIRFVYEREGSNWPKTKCANRSVA